MSKQSLLIVGCGQLGNAMAPELIAENRWNVFGMRRKSDKIATGIQPIAADYTDAQAFTDVLGQVKPDYIVLTLTPSARSAEAYEAGYLQPIRNLLASIEHKVRHLVFVSSTSVYAQHENEWVDERSATEPIGYSGKTMLECERLLHNSGLSFTSLRCGGIYGSGAGHLLSQVKAGEFSGSTHYTNRIHFMDCAAAIAHLLEQHRQNAAVADIYLGVDSSPCKKLEIEQWLAKQLAVPIVEASRERQSSARNPGSKRCSNQRLLQSGFQFRYPSYKEGYATMLENFD